MNKAELELLDTKIIAYEVSLKSAKTPIQCNYYTGGLQALESLKTQLEAIKRNGGRKRVI